MKSYTLISHNSIETMEFASRLASKLHIGDIVILSGELGSGKTKFTEGFLKYWSLDKEISSPTFNIVNEYKTDNVKIYHFDVYRIGDIEEMDEIGYEDYFYGEGVCLVEWANLIEELMPEQTIWLTIEKDLEKGFDYRKISVNEQ